MITPPRTRLASWEEICGVLRKIRHEEDFVVVEIGEINLMLPTEVGIALTDLCEHRLSILRTDLVDEPYLVIEVDASGKMVGSIIPACDKVSTDEGLLPGDDPDHHSLNVQSEEMSR